MTETVNPGTIRTASHSLFKWPRQLVNRLKSAFGDSSDSIDDPDWLFYQAGRHMGGINNPWNMSLAANLFALSYLKGRSEAGDLLALIAERGTSQARMLITQITDARRSPEAIATLQQELRTHIKQAFAQKRSGAVATVHHLRR